MTSDQDRVVRCLAPYGGRSDFEMWLERLCSVLAGDNGYHSTKAMGFFPENRIRPLAVAVRGRCVKRLDGRIFRSPGYQGSQKLRKTDRRGARRVALAPDRPEHAVAPDAV